MTTLKPNNPNHLKKQYWYFTFCQRDQVYKDSYVKFYGTYDEARIEMFKRFGDYWAFQYDWKEIKSQIDMFGLEEVVFEKESGGN